LRDFPHGKISAGQLSQIAASQDCRTAALLAASFSGLWHGRIAARVGFLVMVERVTPSLAALQSRS
jgi:hypothetical protein